MELGATVCGPNRAPQCDDALMFRSKRWVFGEPPLERHGLRCVEFAIDKRVKEQVQIQKISGQSVLVDHDLPPSFEISAARARARRDMTVPSGRSSTAAISR